MPYTPISVLLHLLLSIVGASKPRPVFRWTMGDTFEDQKHLKANRTEHYNSGHVGIDRQLDDLKGGESMASIVEFVAHPIHNGRIYRCYSQNPTIVNDDGEPHQEVNATVTIVVLCEYFLLISYIPTIIDLQN